MATATNRRQGAVAAAERGVAVAGPVSNSLFITGDGVTVRYSPTGVGGVLAFCFRWQRPRRRKRRDRQACPVRFASHLDRSAESEAMLGDRTAPRVVNLFGPQAIGKTYVLVDVLNSADEGMPDGVVYLQAEERSGDDLLHGIFDAVFECRAPRRDLRVERYLSRVRAAIGVDGGALRRGEGQRLALAVPASQLFITSRERLLWDGTAIELRGLAPEFAPQIAEQELGRPLDELEHRAAELIGAALNGRPLDLRQVFSRAAAEGKRLDEVARAVGSDPGIDERLGPLPPESEAVARALAVFGTAPLGLEHLESIVDSSDVEAAAELLERRHAAASHSPRYSLVGALASALGNQKSASEETERAIRYFTSWLERHQDKPSVVVRELPALLALIDRAYREGRSEAVIDLGRMLDRTLVLTNRWEAWGHVLALMHACAERLKDEATVAWVLHQEGTRAYGLGEPQEGRAALERALKLRERFGDEDGAKATRQNLRVVTRPMPFLLRLSHAPFIVLAISAILVLSAAVAGADVLRSPTRSSHETPVAAAPHSKTLTLRIDEHGPGLVVSDPTGISCPPACSERVTRGSEIALIARPAAGALFVGWMGNGCSGARRRCAVRINRSVDLRAVFARGTPTGKATLRVTLDGEGKVITRPVGIDCPGRCSASFGQQQHVILTAAAGQGSVFTGWGGDCAGTQACQLTMSAAHSVVARFSQQSDTRTITVTKAGEGQGLVLSQPSGIDCGSLCSASLASGTTIVLSAVPAPGSRFTGWETSARCAGQVDCRLAVTSNLDVVARFTLASQPGALISLTVSRVGAGLGTVRSDPAGIVCPDQCSATFTKDSAITLTADAPTGYVFDGWKGSGCSGTAPCRLRLSAPSRVFAVFGSRGPTRYTLTTVVNRGTGSITPDCSNGCPEDRGTVVTVEATAAVGGHVVWDKCPEPNGSTCRVLMDQNRQVEVTFASFG